MPDDSFSIAVYTPTELASQPALVHAVVELVNNAYFGHGDFEEEARFKRDQALIDNIRENGLCAVVVDENANDGDAPKVIASVSANVWKEAEGEPSLNYELSAVATLNSPPYRKRGLVDRCTLALQSALLERLRPSQRPDFRLWLIAVEHLNGAYWRRRGYKHVRTRVMPVGTWGARREFELATLVKRVGGLEGKDDVTPARETPEEAPVSALTPKEKDAAVPDELQRRSERGMATKTSRETVGEWMAQVVWVRTGTLLEQVVGGGPLY
ncbi:hypothetical protein BDY21DRAFT_356546 [Lineolata rhizophorae]|uniref:N-acetyltransferase domain-containing protein n=1 Tax=Lineolata rhizophorae TaxID=578093 RepID=A0A6A6NNN8_9PEZI|nr:hypothetical protein BDY21DRAFT_356546 [Lineolata rhizophorae]